jgi:radical SAM protein with 4Fe4S-binding SPASM domain
MYQHFKKTVNLIGSSYSYVRSVVTGNASVIGMPLAIGAELTNNCNLRCPECSSGSGSMTRGRGYMETDLFQRVIGELSPYLYNINLYFQGEPMLHPRFFTFLELGRNLRTVISTNGHFLNEDNAERIVNSGLSVLIVSLDGLDQETYSAYRINGSFQTVINGLKALSLAKKRFSSPLKVEIQFLVNRMNEHQVGPVKEMASELGFVLSLKSMQVKDKDNIQKWLPRNNQFGRYILKDHQYSIKSSLPNRCPRMWFNPVITWDGKVIPCCFDKDAEYIMGDLAHDSFSEIWNSPKYSIFRKSILNGRNMIEMCRNCTSGLRLRY